MTHPDHALESRARRGWLSYRIGSLIGVLAVVPLLGAGWFAGREVVDARREHDRATDVDRWVREMVTLADLRAGLVAERNWQLASDGVGEVGLSVELVRTLTGIDLPVQSSVARERVDKLIAGSTMGGLADDLARVRTDPGDSFQDRSVKRDGYQVLEDEIGDHEQFVMDRLLDSAGDARNASGLLTGLRVMRAAKLAQQAAAAEFLHYFSARLSPVADRDDDVYALIAQDTLRRRALDEVERISSASSLARSAVAAVATSPDIATFTQAADELVQNFLSAEFPDAADDVTVIVDRLREEADTFRASSAGAELYFELISRAGDDALMASDDLRTDAADRNRDALAMLAALALCSVLFAVAATRAIGRPLARLAQAARQVRDGRPANEPMRANGPIEVREAAHAIDEAARHLALAERQALALADGDLEHSSLREVNGGSLGASLQSAVRTLAASMHEREEFRQQMAYEAGHDGLTHLPNRNTSLAHLQRSLDADGVAPARLAVFFIDLDGFKDVNDHHGHHAGDAVLCHTSTRLLETVRHGDHVGRLGGDEFIVIAQPLADIDEAMVLAERIRDALTAPIQLDAATVSVQASIGIAVWDGDARGASDLLRDADLAVYKAKEEGRGRIEVCDDALRAAMLDRVDIEQALRSAVIEDRLVLHYQPIVRPADQSLCGFEALLRWNRPGHGLVSADQFIPLAERSDLIITIDRWVLRNVAHQIVSWDANHQFAHVPVSVNVSGRHLSSPDFVNHVLAPLDEYGIDPGRIVVEVTESALLQDLTAAAGKLQQLRHRGVRTAIDDFGTGYTSLAHLRNLPIDILKIDRSFTTDVSAAALVQLIIDTGHLMGAIVTAEGIETEWQAEELHRMGSDELQGFLFGYPLPAEELSAAHQRRPIVAPNRSRAVHQARTLRQ